MIYEYNGKKPKIGENVFIAPTASVIGDVELGDGSSVWYGVVLRGDEGKILVGAGGTYGQIGRLAAIVGAATAT